MHILPSVAEFERSLIRERVSAGIKSAQKTGTRSGKPIGRPEALVDRGRVVELRDAGAFWATLAEALGVPSTTIRNATLSRHLAENLRARDGPFVRKTDGDWCLGIGLRKRSGFGNRSSAVGLCGPNNSATNGQNGRPEFKNLVLEFSSARSTSTQTAGVICQPL